MSLNIYRGWPVWVPEDATRLQRFSLKWRLLNLSIALILTAVSAVGISFLMASVLAGLTGTILAVKISPTVTIVGGTVGLASCIVLILNTVAFRVRGNLRYNPGFRFRSMQGDTPSFKVLNLYNTMNKVPLSPKQRHALDAWLETRWNSDHDPTAPFDPWEASSEWMCAQLAERIATFRELPLHFPGGFDAACNDLLTEYHKKWAERLEEQLNSLRGKTTQAQNEVRAAKRKLTDVRRAHVDLPRRPHGGHVHEM